jgi:anion-transporting  ArsA/GET3 family ATPase
MMDQENVMNKLEELFQKVKLLEQSIQAKSNPPIIVKVDVKDLHLNELNLEELAFHLDKLDIKEISGMLNLGNTFSPRVHPKSKPKHPSTQENPQQEEEEKNKADEIQVNINHKPVPYTIS